MIKSGYIMTMGNAKDGEQTNWIRTNKKGQSISQEFGGAYGVMVIVIGNGHSDTSSNLGQDWMHFT